MQVKFSDDDALVSFETTEGYSLSVVPDCNDILVESGENNEDRG